MSFVNFEMPYKWIIVVATYYFGMDDFWDVLELLVLEHSFDIFPILREVCKASEYFCFFVVVLQFRQL